MATSDGLAVAAAAAPPSLFSSAATMGPTVSIQTTATPKSPPKAAEIAELQQSRSDQGQSRLKKSATSSRSGSKTARKKRNSFTEEKREPVKAWYYNPHSEEDPEEKDPTLPHHFQPDRQVPLQHLENRQLQAQSIFEQVKNERGYNYEEVVTVAPGRLENYEQKKKDFFKEHLHEHEEIRLILEGGGYEDIRDFDGHWIRIHITPGVLIVLPKGMYHRFTLDDTNHLKAVLLYQQTPSRIQFDRNAGTDIMEVRERYVSNVLSRGASLKGNSSDLSNMLEGLDEELEILRKRQEIVEATLDETGLSADDALVAAQFQPQGSNNILNCKSDVLRPPHNVPARTPAGSSSITGPLCYMEVDA